MKKNFILIGCALLVNMVLQAQNVSSCRDLPELFRKKNAEYAPEIKRTVSDSCLSDLVRVLKNKKYTELHIEFSALPDSAFWNILPPELEFLSVFSANGYAGLPASLGKRTYQLELKFLHSEQALEIPSGPDVPVLQYSSMEPDSFYSFVYNKGGERREIQVDAAFYRADSAGWQKYLRARFPNYTRPEYRNMTEQHISSYGLLPQLRSRNEVLKTFSAAETVYLSLDRGQYIYIPAGSLMRSNGQEYAGKVVLRYRSWTTIEDMMDARLPMWTRSPDGKDTVLFQTAGMFEMRAYSPEGDTLQIKPGSRLDLIYPQTDSSLADYTYYEFNEQQNTWNDTGTVSERMNWSNAGGKISVRAAQGPERDFRTWDQRFADLKTIFKLDSGRAAGYVHGGQKVYRDKINRGGSSIKMRPVKYMSRDSTLYTQVELYGRLLDAMPDLRALLRTIVLADYMPANDFRKRYTKGRRYHDLDIRNEGGGRFTLILKHRTGYEEMELLMFQPWRYRGNVPRSAARRVQLIERSLNRRENIFNADVVRQEANWLRAGLQNEALRNRIGSVSIGVRRFGLINFDKLYPMPDKQNYLAAFYQGDKALDVELVQVLDVRARGIFSHFPREGDARVPFFLSRANTHAVFVTTGEGQIFAFKGAELQRMHNELQRNARCRVPDPEAAPPAVSE